MSRNSVLCTAAGLHQRIIEAVGSGLLPRDIDRSLGLARGTVDRWLSIGDQDLEAGHASAEARLARTVGQARAAVEAQALKVIRDAATAFVEERVEQVRDPDTGNWVDSRRVVIRKLQWQAAKWYLERTNPESYAPQPKDRKVQHLHAHVVIEDGQGPLVLPPAWGKEQGPVVAKGRPIDEASGEQRADRPPTPPPPQSKPTSTLEYGSVERVPSISEPRGEDTPKSPKSESPKIRPRSKKPRTLPSFSEAHDGANH